MALLNSKFTIGIVGSRNCTDYGRKVTKEFAREISKSGICVVSGMALGIDGIAHDTALSNIGSTIAILGGGFNNIYPKENEWLFYKIIENGGCIISEYLPDEKVEKKNFPNRNRIISGLSDAILVVEATYRSGSSITAKYANAQGKRVFAVPNNIFENTGIGTNILIQNGATLITKSKQIIDEVKGKSITVSNKVNLNSKCDREIDYQKQEKEANNVMKSEYLEIYRLLSNKSMHINEISIKLNKSVQKITSTIIMMELEGYIEQVQANYFKRKDVDI